MKIDLHIHSKDGSDGRWTVEAIFAEAHKRGIDLISITDHDSIDAQEKAIALARSYAITYFTGVEMNITFSDLVTKRGNPSPSMCSAISMIFITPL